MTKIKHTNKMTDKKGSSSNPLGTGIPLTPFISFTYSDKGLSRNFCTKSPKYLYDVVLSTEKTIIKM
ncbi:MAG: hypothetical protein Q4F97_07870 [Bacteroidales bacterium]|nr:hypothetical protein [Bacteroidales bacterium]